MRCLTCGTKTTPVQRLCSTTCREQAKQELSRNRTRLGELRERRTGPPCAESRRLIDRNSQLHDGLQRLPEAVSV